MYRFRRHAESLKSSESEDGGTEDVSVFHPFENKCKFPINNIYPLDISHYKLAARLRQLQCPYENYDCATMDSEGYIMLLVVFLEGGLRDNETGIGKDDFVEVAEVEAPENQRFLANGDAFYIRCFNKGEVIWEEVFPGMRDLDKELHKVYLVKDLPSFDSFGRRLNTQTKQEFAQRYSIDILGFDSASRTMFMRHLPRSMETMNKLGFEMFYGYNKVGDNSEPNLVPILAGDLPEALEMPKLNDFEDINNDWILPTKQKLDPDKLPFLWKTMESEYGCRSMLNEDISKSMFGLFYYPARDFLPGFTSTPADHFYRAYYLAAYKNWSYSPCRDGDQYQRRYVDLWRRFANKYKDLCHFGFTFVTTLSHERGFTLELLDEQVSSSLDNLYRTGALDKGVTVIMSDHGNRIGLVQFSYNGRIEERMPLMAIRLPPDFKKYYPREYANFLKNKWKLTRTCFDAYISENFCTCMIDRSDMSAARTWSEVQENLVGSIQNWIERDYGLSNCLEKTSIKVIGNATVLGLNHLARHGLRNWKNTRKLLRILKMLPHMDYLHHEITALIETTMNRGLIRLLFRIEEAVKANVFEVVFEPLVQDAPWRCYSKSVFRVCKCLNS